MSNLFELLAKIRQQPGLYLGTPSITILRHFLVGYKFARQELGILPIDLELDFYQEFQPWLQSQLKVQTPQSWDKIILIRSIDEKTAFNTFFELLEEFCHRNQSNTPIPLNPPIASKEQAA